MITRTLFSPKRVANKISNNPASSIVIIGNSERKRERERERESEREREREFAG